MNYEGKVCGITGAANGIGKGFALYAAAKGMKMALLDIEEDTLEKVKEECIALGAADVLTVVVDVTDSKQVKDSVDKIMEYYGRIDMFYTNAGVAGAGTLVNIPVCDWDWITAANFLSMAYYAHYVLPIMTAQGTEAAYFITVSIGGLMPGMSFQSAYTASKHAAMSLAETIRDYAKKEAPFIKVVAFCPEYINTTLPDCEKRRPEKFADPDNPFFKTEDYIEYAKNFRIKLANGYNIRFVGPRLFKALEDGQFYVHPHMHTHPWITNRFDRIRADLQKDVELDAEFKALEGYDELTPDQIPMYPEYAGKVCGITGAAYGIGEAFAYYCAQNGMKLALIDIDLEHDKLQEVKAKCEELGAETIAIDADVSDYAQVKDSVKAIMDRYGRIDMFYSNAGVASAGTISHFPIADWDWITAVNFLGMAYYAIEVLPIMAKQGTPADYLMTVSIGGLHPGFSFQAAYTASKHAAMSLAESISDWASKDADFIRVSAFCPEYVNTTIADAYRRRPERFRVDDPFFQSAECVDYLEAFKGRLKETGYNPRFVGPRMFRALKDGQLYVHPHLHTHKLLHDRFAEVEADLAKDKDLDAMFKPLEGYDPL